MARMLPDPTFYASPSHAMTAPPEELAYVALLNVGGNGTRDAIGVVDTEPSSPTYGQLVGRTELPQGDNELHHFGWNACSSHLCPWAPHAHVERRYLVVPGIHSSRIHVLDTRPDPRAPRLVKVIEAEEIARRSGYQALHTVHCGPDGIYVNALGGVDGDGPGGILVLDHETFAVKGAWEKDRGPQHLAYDFAWHLGHDTMISSEWGTPNMVTEGVNPELLLAGKYGHALHVWNLRRRTHEQRIELGPEQQMVLELRPARNPTRAYGFVGVVISLEDLSSSIFLWYLDRDASGHGTGNGRDGEWKVRKVITIPAEPADPALLPPLLQGFGVVPPLVSDLNLSLDDRFLYVSCWGTGETRQYDVSDPFHPVLTGSVRLGGIVRRTPHPSAPDRPLNGASQMVEVSRDGRRVYITNSLYSPWDAQFYPDGIRGWIAKLDAGVDGGLAPDPRFLVELEEGVRPHQVRLAGGDASSDSFCYAE
ncbi:MAG TPA: selenium-binding protein SBP56-related protein [Gemmatimonadaceae bacterium]|nr:selenium-binding protein SBP56-related protein [Gemmatimonadaceae bacterium]